MINRQSRKLGFTLIEILIVMLITSILILGINTAYRQAYLLWSNIENKRPLYNNARLITETLRQELSCLYFPSDANQQDSPFELLSSTNETTELNFYTLTPSWKSDPASSRMAKVRYRFSRDEITEETLLQRFEQACAGEKIIGKESSDVIATGLSDFKIWAADPNASLDLWKQSYATKDAPPKAFKIFMKWAANGDNQQADFQTSIIVPCQGILMP